MLHRHHAVQREFRIILASCRIHHLLITVPHDVPARILPSAKYPQPQTHIASSEEDFLFIYFFFISYSRSEVNQLQSMLTLWNTKALHQNKNIWGQSCFMNTQIINSSCVLPVATSATQAVLLVCLLVWGLFCVCVYLDSVLHSSVKEFACRHIWFFENEELRRSINI